ncbi:hypothetical protein PRZ48_006541 [Zasmidium cellare]|uniref:Uncharacterized protein n=1 Tax=Zasmidium cellare TaxID=395010 RepID=A0ABR0EP15_ZASCE|nr:hypothetical protein PRZ48_006541 [Zasmidium cellare]
MAGIPKLETPQRAGQRDALGNSNRTDRQTQGPRAKYMLYPYYALMITTTAATQYMMIRMVLGHKTWFGSN